MFANLNEFFVAIAHAWSRPRHECRDLCHAQGLPTPQDVIGAPRAFGVPWLPRSAVRGDYQVTVLAGDAVSLVVSGHGSVSLEPRDPRAELDAYMTAEVDAFAGRYLERYDALSVEPVAFEEREEWGGEGLPAGPFVACMGYYARCVVITRSYVNGHDVTPWHAEADPEYQIQFHTLAHMLVRDVRASHGFRAATEAEYNAATGGPYCDESLAERRQMGLTAL